MKIIVTGATGFIGRNIAESFHESGINVVATGRSLEVGSELHKKGIEFVQADITKHEQIEKAFSSADYLIHCAAKTADWGKYREFYETNVIGTRNIIKACKLSNVKKIIYISTPSVYFSGKDRLNISEDDPIPEKQFKYGKTKLIAERELLALKNEGFKTIVLRPRAVYGRYDNTIIPRVLKLSEKKRIPLINSGAALVDITYIDNLVNSVKNCLSAPDDAWSEIYNISNGDPISIKDWFSQILDIFCLPFNPAYISEPAAKLIAGITEAMSIFPFGNKKPAMTRFSVGYMAKSMTLSLDKAKEKLNYKPEISNLESLERCRKWYS